MTLAEIQKLYPNEWALIEFTELDDEYNVVDGEVIAHSPSKEEIDQILASSHQPKIAVEYLGTWPDDGVGYLL